MQYFQYIVKKSRNAKKLHKFCNSYVCSFNFHVFTCANRSTVNTDQQLSSKNLRRLNSVKDYTSKNRKELELMDV
jgi:hypothetical protein